MNTTNQLTDEQKLVAQGKEAWFSENHEMLLQDENGQVYVLTQLHPHSNVYTVWLAHGENRGVKESLSHRHRIEFLESR